MTRQLTMETTDLIILSFDVVYVPHTALDLCLPRNIEQQITADDRLVTLLAC